MKITKIVHSCLLVETPDRTALFDPGFMSEPLLDVEKLTYLDDIFITHEHGDHFYLPLVKKLVERFPNVRITAPPSVVVQLQDAAVRGTSEAPTGVQLFESPHESVEPLFSTPEETGYHYLDLLTHPGDSHSFTETKSILALPVTAPWGTVMNAAKLAVSLKPKHVIPIHDWHWRDEVRTGMHESLAEYFEGKGIHFVKAVNGEAFTLDG
jgi:L-ascorbate metabolism protein UlaG (beta-lactamase superfamily)